MLHDTKRMDIRRLRESQLSKRLQGPNRRVSIYDEKKAFEDHREIESRVVKCEKPREVPKCCKEPPYWV